MDLYFERHDGQAVTCEEFVARHRGRTGVDLRQFGAGTARPARPSVTAESHYDAAAKRWS